MPDTIDFTEEAAPQIDFLADEDVAKIGIEKPQRAINQSLRTMQLGALAAPEPPPPTPPLNRVVGKYGLEPSPGTQTLIGPQLSRLAQAIPPGQGPVTRPLSSLSRTALGFGAAALEPQNLLATSFAISPPGALAVGGYFGYQGVKGALDSVRNIVKLMQAPGPVDAAFKQKLSDELVNALSMAVAAGEISAAEARGIRQMVTKPPVQGPLATGAILSPRRGALPMAGPERLGPPVPPARVRSLQEAEANLPGGAPPIVTAAEAGRDESVIEEIRRRNLNTNEKILNAFPELRTRPSPNQQAARLRRAAAERQGPPLPPGAAPQAPRPLGVRTGELQGPDRVVAGTRPVVQPMRVENQPVFQGPQIPEVVQAQREREAGMQRELEARRSALQQSIVFWERELEMARNRGDRRAQDNAAKQLLLFRGEYEGIPPVKEIVPKPPIPRAPGSAFRPEVPGTPGQEQESVLAEIRRKNLRTRQQVINNFPGFREGGRSGERAAELLRQAWPQVQGPPLPPEEPPAEPPGPTVPKPAGPPPAAPSAAIQSQIEQGEAILRQIEQPTAEEAIQASTQPTTLPAKGTEAPPLPESARQRLQARVRWAREEGVLGPEAAPSPTPATPTPAPEAPVTPEEITTEPAVPTAPAAIEDTPLAGKTLGEWEAIKDASQLPRGTARAELAKWLAVPNQPSRILQALGNKRRTREIHAPPMEITPIAPAPAPAPEVPASEAPTEEPPAAAAPPTPAAPPSAPAAPTEPPTTSVESAPQVEQAAAKAQAEVSKTAAIEGQRPAKDVKQDLIDGLQQALMKAPREAKEGDKVTIAIPGDGTFKVVNAVEPISEVLARAKKIETNPNKPTKISKKQIQASSRMIAKSASTPPSMGPGAAAVAEFDEAPPDLEVMGLKTGSPFINEMDRRWRNLFAGFGQLTGRGKTKKDIALSINAMETIPNMAAQQAGNSFRLMLDDVRQQRAVTALMQSLKMSGEGLSQEDAARLGELQFAGDPQGYLRAKQTDMETLAQSQLSKGKRLEAQAAKEWAIALSDARTQFNQLRPVAQEAKRRLDRQLRREAAAGIETNYELWYVPQRYDFDLLPSANRPIVIGGQRGGSPSTSFRKAKYFEDYASAMEAGHIPRTFSIADLIEHRVRQGERLVARKAMFQGLKGMTDDLTGDPIAMNIPKRVIERPDGSVDVQESIPRDYEPVDVIPGVRLAIHKGYARGIRAMTGTSQISESAIVSSLQNLAAVEKHLGLALDTFHLSRTLQTEFALTHRMSLPFTERTRRGAALVEYSTADLDRAVQKGEITQGIADWITKPQSFNVQGRDIQMSPKAVVNLGARNGLGIGRIADVIYKDWIRQTPVFGTINKLVFDKITRSAVAQGFISEFDRVSRQHPEWAGEKVAKTVASDINVLFGNLQKESWVKSPSLNALMQIAFLAPNWVQSLIRREARAVIQVGQAAVGVAKGEGFRIGSAGKAMGEGVLMYLVGTQLLNLITRGHLTFQNEEEGHKLDAFIPDPFTPGKGFFISPLSVFGEITHDLIRYAQSKPDLATAITQIGANKFGNVGRAIAVTATGRDPIDNHKLIGTANRAMAAAYQLIPVPITLSGVGKEALGKSFPDLVTRPTTTQVGRQVASSLGFKVEPAPTAQAQISALVDRWKAGQEPAVASQVTRRLQEDFGPSNYRELRSALVNEQTDQATRAYRALRQEGKTPEQIRKIIEHPHPFAGSRALEARFVDSLSPQEQKLYERALDEREEIISRFEQMLDNRPQLTEEESQ